MGDHTSILLFVLALIMVIGVRVLAGGFFKTTSIGTRVGLSIGLFVLYTIILLLLLYNVYCTAIESGSGIQEYHQMVVVVVIVMQVIVLFAGIMYYALYRKQKISKQKQ